VNVTVLSLDTLRAGDSAQAGGKGANLGELLGQGFPVPPGFVVCAAAYASFLETAGLRSEIAGLRDLSHEDAVTRCSAIRERLAAADLPPEVSAAILEAHAKLIARDPAVLCAVRSSATAEDLGAASFAGQHGTYYYVDAAHLLQMIKRCWASLWSPEAVSYRATHGIEHAAVSMAVVVQEMIASEVSGVAFTANPVNGSRNELIIEASWGMGAALVDGRVTPDRYIVVRDGLALRERRIAEKRFMVSPHLEPGRQARLEEVPHNMRRRETLSLELLRTVTAEALKCEEHFGKPQDVEWAIRDGRFYLLQSRPITVMGREEIGRGVEGKHVLFKATVENFTDPLTPLTQGVFSSIRPPGLRFIRGWIYADADFLRRILPFQVSAEEAADLFYSGSREAPAWKLSPLKLPAVLLFCVLNYLVFGVLLVRTRRLPDGSLEGFRRLCRRVEEDTGMGPEAALKRLFLLPSIFDPIAHMAILVNVLSFRFLLWMAVLRRLLKRWAPDLRSDADVLLGSGAEGVLSAEMGRGIWALGRQAKNDAQVRQILLDHPPERALATLRQEPEARDFLAALDRFLEVNGHRALKEFEIRSVRWEEDPAPVLGMIRNYLLIESDPADQDSKTAAARTELTEELRRRLGFRYGLVAYAAERVRYFFKLRENSRFYHIMVFGVIRKKVLKMEAALLREGKLRCKDDIFFLRSEELAALQAGRTGWLDVEDRIRERRIAHIRLSKMGPPKTIGFELPRKHPAGQALAGATLLGGQTASPGRYEGRARVILDPSLDAELKPGEVLVAPYTDPAWTPLFLTAGAAVVEIGSYLSHAGTVAREFGLPCVVDVAEATERIRNGDRIAVDGDQGSVHVFAAEEEKTS
jgi:pyruvate,water dikinase